MYELIYAIIMGGVFHETFVSFITFEVYMFKDSNLLCWKEDRHFLQTIYSNPPEGGGSNIIMLINYEEQPVLQWTLINLYT